MGPAGVQEVGIDYSYFRSRRENDWYPHYIHNLDNLIRFGGLYPPDPRPRGHPQDQAAGHDVGVRGRLHAGAGQGPRLQDAGPQGKKIGLTRSLNTIKNDWWRIQEAHGHRERCSGSTT